MRLSALVFQFRKGIILAISLVVFENIAWILEPTVFGNVIDAFIDKSVAPSEAEFILPLSVWIGVFLTNSGLGALRRSLDQRIYLKMFTEIATNVVREARQQGQSTSRTAARGELTREYISFLQYRLPEIAEQSIAIVGTVIALLFFDWRIAVTCLFIVVPLYFMTRVYNRKVSIHQKALHDTREEAFDVYAMEDLEAVRSYYQRLTHHEQKIADWGALNFGVLRFFLLGIFLIVLYISIDLDDFTTGNIYSIVAYLWTFVTSTEYLPELLESTSSLRDLSRRLASEE
jgi:ABC-type multidrug transport system fused ATPase/permease subunit